VLSRRIAKKAHLGKSTPHSHFFLVKDYIHKFFVTIMIIQPQPKLILDMLNLLLRHAILYDCNQIAIDNAN